MLNKFEKEELVVKLLNEGRTIRQIAAEAHISFKDIGLITRKLNGDVKKPSSLKSIETQALFLFAEGKSQIDVATELDISYLLIMKMATLAIMQNFIKIF